MPNVDERVVQMTFDNRQFESGVSQSLKTLDDLKKALNFDEVEGSLKNIENAFNNLNLSGLADSVDFIASRFEPLGKIADVALTRIADKALDAGKKITDAFFGFSDMSAGQSKYETRTKAVQTIMNATGKSIEEVEAVLDSLQTYTDETSYDFAAMVDNIGKFTSVGVDLEMAEKAMEGIGNEAAKSGASIQQANHAMYNFAQALSQGAVKLQDWRSISNATMATKEFKEMLISTAIEIGTLESAGENVGSLVSTNEKQLAAGEKALAKAQKATKDRAEKVAAAQEKIASATKKTEVNFQNFESTLSDGWLTSDVLIKTLNKYSDMNTDFGREAYYAAQKALTFTDAIQATKDAVSSGWMDSFGYIFGNLEEAMELWTNVANALYEYVAIFADWRNEILKSWHEMGGYNDLIEAASNLWQTFMNIVKGVGDALTNVFPILKPENMTQALVDGTKALKDWSADLLEMFGLQQKVTEEEEETAEQTEEVADKVSNVKENIDSSTESMTDLGDASKEVAKSVDGIETGIKRGMRGDNVKALQQKLVSLGFRLDKFGVDGIFGPETQGAVEELQRALGVEVTGALDEATLAALNTEEGMAKLQERMHKGLSTGDVGEDVRDIQNELNKYLGDNDKLVADGIYGPKTKAAVEKLQKELGVEVTGTWDDATRTAFESSKMILFGFEKIRKGIKRGEISNEVKALQEQLIKTGYLTDQSVADGIYGPKTEEAVKKLQKDLGVEETGVWDEATYRAAVRAKRMEKANLDSAKSAEEASETINDASEKNEEASESADKATSHTTVAMMRLQNIVKGWAAALKIAGKFAASVVKIGKNILAMFKPLIDVAYRFGSVFGTMFQNLAEDLDKNNVYGSFVDKVTSAFGPFGALLKAIADALDGFLDSYDAFLESTGKKNTFGSFFEFIGAWIGKIPLLGLVADIFDSIGSAIGQAISVLSTWFSEVSKWFSSDTFKQGKDNVFNWIVTQANKIRGIFNSVMTWFGKKIETFKSWFASDAFKQGKENVFNWIITQATKIRGAFNSVMSWFGKKIETFKSWFSSTDFSIGGFSGSTFLDDLKSRFEALEPIISFAEKIKNRLVSLWQSIFGGSAENEVTASYGGSSKSIKSSPMIQSLQTAEEQVSLFDKTVNTILQIKNKLVSALKGVFSSKGGENGSASVLDKLKDFCNFILDHWFEVALGAAGIAVTYGLVSAIKIAKGFANAFEDIGSAIKDKLGKEDKKDTFGTTALKIAGALLIMAGAVAILSKIDAGEAWKGIVPFLVVLGAMTTAIILVNKLGGENGDGAKQALMLAGSIGIIAASIWLLCRTLSSYSTEIILGAMGIVTLMVVVLGAIAVKLSKQKGSGVELKGFLSMCTGVFVLVLAFEKMIKVINKNINNPGVMIAAFAIIEIMLLTLGGIAKGIAKKSVMGQGSAEGYLSLCSGIMVLVLAFEKLIKILKKNADNPGVVIAAFVILEIMLLTLGKVAKGIAKKGVLGNSSVDGYLGLCTGMYALVIAFEKLINIIKKNADSPGVVIGAFVILELMLLGLGHVGKSMAKSGTSGLKGSIGLLAIAAALFIIVETFGRLVDIVSNNKFENVAAAFGGLIVLMGSIAMLGKAVGKLMSSVKSIIGFLLIGATVAGLMYVFGNALEKTKGIDANAMTAFATGLSEMFLAVSIAGGIAGKLGAGTTFLGIIAVVGGIAAVIAALSGILAIPGVEQFLSGGMEKIGKLIGTLIGSMKAAEFESFNKAITNMESVASVDQSKVDNAIAAAQAIADFGAGLPEKSVINTIVDRIFGSELWQFSQDMTAFGTGFNGFVTQIMSITNYSSEEIQNRTSTAISVAEAIRDFGNSLPEKSVINTIVDRIFGSELWQFSQDMTAFGTGFNGFVTQIMTIDPSYTAEEITSRTTLAVSIATAINDFASNLEGKTIPEKIVDKFFGSELDQFSSDMQTFGSKFNDYAGAMGSISTDKNTIEKNTDNAIATATKIANFLESLSGMNIETKHSGILGWFETETTGETVFDSIERLGKSISGSQDSFSGISASTLVSDVTAATSVAESVAKLLSYLGSGDVYSNITAGAQGLDALSSMFNDSEFSLASVIKDFATQMGSIDNLPEVSNIFSGFGLLAGSISSNETVKTSFTNAGKSLAVQLVLALAGELGSSENVQKIADAETGMINSVVSSIEPMKFKFEFLGRMMDHGLADGLAKSSSVVTEMAKIVAINAYNAAKNALEVESPSKKFMWLGSMTGEGLVKGIESYSKTVKDASADVAEGAVDSAKNGISLLSEILKLGDIDDQPVIRPVVDLTNIQNASGSINDLMTSSGHLKVNTRLVSSVATGFETERRAKEERNNEHSYENSTGRYYNGDGSSGGNAKSVDISALGELGIKFDRLAEKLSSMQVVLDTGEFVGATVSAYDKQFGKMTGRRERGN